MRVAVTGLGAVCALGPDLESGWCALREGRSGLVRMVDAHPDLRTDVVARAPESVGEGALSPRERWVHGRSTVLAIAAAEEASRMAGLEGVDGDRVACLVSTGQGATDVMERQLERCREKGPRAVSPYFVPAVMANAPAAVLAARNGWRGPSFNLASACATGAHALLAASLLLEAGHCDAVVVGASESSLGLGTLAGFGNAGALSVGDGPVEEASQPWGRHRRGFVAGEGAGVLVLEREDRAVARGASPLGWLLAAGATTDGTHLTRPDATGAGLARAASEALARAGLEPQAVGVVSAHATSTVAGDAAEVLALRAVFGDRMEGLALTGLKGALGHTLGASAALEAVLAIRGLRDGLVPPTLVPELDPELGPLDVVRETRPVDRRVLLKLSAGFGGHNAALLFEVEPADA